MQPAQPKSQAKDIKVKPEPKTPPRLGSSHLHPLTLIETPSPVFSRNADPDREGSTTAAVASWDDVQGADAATLQDVNAATLPSRPDPAPRKRRRRTSSPKAKRTTRSQSRSISRPISIPAEPIVTVNAAATSVGHENASADSRRLPAILEGDWIDALPQTKGPRMSETSRRAQAWADVHYSP